MTSAMKWKDACFLESYGKPRQRIKKQRHDFANKGPYSQSYGFSSSFVLVWELGHKASWAPKNWCFWIVVLVKTLESPLDCKETKPVSPKGNQTWIFIEGLMLKLKLQYFGHLMQRANLLKKTLILGKNWGQEKGTTEDEMVGWHHRLNGHEFEQTLGDSEGQGGLGYCSPWGCKESDMT